jgi:hypothetical protein
MVVYGCVWLCMVVYGCVWLCMVVYVCVWLCMFVYACVCLCMFVYICVCLCMLVYACVCLCMLVYACVCLCMLVYACVCLCMYVVYMYIHLISTVPDPMELGYYYVPPAPQPPPPAAPNRNPLLDKLLEALIGSVKFFANGENFTVASAELMAKVNGVFELARLMKLTRMKETEHEHVWAQVGSSLLVFSTFFSVFSCDFVLFPNGVTLPGQR